MIKEEYVHECFTAPRLVPRANQQLVKFVTHQKLLARDSKVLELMVCSGRQEKLYAITSVQERYYPLFGRLSCSFVCFVRVEIRLRAVPTLTVSCIPSLVCDSDIELMSSACL